MTQKASRSTVLLVRWSLAAQYTWMQEDFESSCVPSSPCTGPSPQAKPMTSSPAASTRGTDHHDWLAQVGDNGPCHRIAGKETSCWCEISARLQHLLVQANEVPVQGSKVTWCRHPFGSVCNGNSPHGSRKQHSSYELLTLLPRTHILHQHKVHFR